MLECVVAEAFYQWGTAWMLLEDLGAGSMPGYAGYNPHTVHISGWMVGEHLGCGWWSESVPFGVSEVLKR